MKDQTDWLGRWARGETGWHQDAVEPALTHWLSGRPNLRVFVPLCGKSLDLRWLIESGHEVVGCELSPLAVESFFAENSIQYTVTEEAPFKIYTGKSITIYCGDFFNLTPSLLGPITALYDRAALIALPSEIRNQYAKHILEITRESRKSSNFEFLQIVLERAPADDVGPPHSISSDEINRHYARNFEITPLHRESVEANGPAGSHTEQHVYLLKPVHQ
jgi:thiopurine S-methyltransferase